MDAQERIDYDIVNGVAVERDVLNIVEAIQMYDENLRVQFLNDPESVMDAPFRVIEKCRDGKDRIAFLAWELDGRLLERVMKADCARQDLDAEMTKKNRAAKDEINRRYREKVDEANEIAYDVLKSRKSKYTVRHPETGELLTFRE